jgi:hypothetical protein
MDYPNDKEVLESFTCTHTLSASYHTAHISRAARALASSTKTSLRIEEKGLLSLQFLMPSGGRQKKGNDAFIEFRVSFDLILLVFQNLVLRMGVLMLWQCLALDSDL